MRGWINDALRLLVGISLALLGAVLEVAQRVRIGRHRAHAAALRRRYDIRDDTPILPYGPEQQASIAVAVRHFREPISWASTSGSTAEPKLIPYPAARIRATTRSFIAAFARDFARSPMRRHSFYAFAGLHLDDSLTSRMTTERRRPPYLVTLQAPYRLHGDGALQSLTQEFGEPAVRLWVLALSNPGLLYATNPSTLSTFLDRVAGDWHAAAALVRRFVQEPPHFSREVHRLAARLTSRGARKRLAAIARSDAPLPFWEIAPAMHSYVCWTGGYVEPFLRRLERHLPPVRYRLLPMYSMSTETPETTPCYRGGRVHFLPLASGVLYEFLPEGAAENASHLLPPEALETGGRYAMVVSDAYGLRRYQTDDLFECVGRVDGLPDLRFVRRRSLSYSFTGEKLTGEQVGMALDRLRDERPDIGRDTFLTCMPSRGDGGLPHYRLVHVRREGDPGAPLLDAAASRLDALLGEINAEYRAKRGSGRLGGMVAVSTPLDDFLKRVGGARAESWEAQFKFLPLYTREWEADVSIR